MKIRIATLKDLDSILRIYEHARSFMASHGIRLNGEPHILLLI